MQPRRARQGNFHGNRNSLMHRMKPPDPSALPSLQARLDLVPRGAKTRPQVFRRQRRVARGRIVDRPVQALHTARQQIGRASWRERGSVRVGLGGRRIIKKKKNNKYKTITKTIKK